MCEEISGFTRGKPEIFLAVFERLENRFVVIAESVRSIRLDKMQNARRYFLIALPMGLVDFFVPFAAGLGILVFESLIFVLGLGCLGLAWFVTKALRQKSGGANPVS